MSRRTGVAGDPAVLEAMGDRELVATTQKAAHARATDTLVAAGDGRSRSQIMADTLVERVTGRTVADPAPIAVNLVITDQALLDPTGVDQEAWVDGYGPVPADLARDLVADTQKASPEAVRLRRLWDGPANRGADHLEASSRVFPATLAALIRFRDQRCHTPWCDSPIRHTDHAVDCAAKRTDDADQRARTVRVVQPRQTSPRLAGQPGHRSPKTHHPHQHPDRTPLRVTGITRSAGDR